MTNGAQLKGRHIILYRERRPLPGNPKESEGPTPALPKGRVPTR